MNWRTWNAIARWHFAYYKLLQERMAQWTCTVPDALARVLKLTDRVERHQSRMDRHDKRIEALEDRHENVRLH